MHRSPLWAIVLSGAIQSLKTLYEQNKHFEKVLILLALCKSAYFALAKLLHLHLQIFLPRFLRDFALAKQIGPQGAYKAKLCSRFVLVSMHVIVLSIAIQSFQTL